MSDVEDEMLLGATIALSEGETRHEYEFPSDVKRGLINDLCRQISADNQKKGFYDDDFLMYKLSANFDGDLKEQYLKAWVTNRKLARIALIESELSEMLEGIRKDAMDEKLPHRTQEEVELADALIRILDYAGAYSLDLGGAVEEKLAYNRTRPYKHGKKV